MFVEPAFHIRFEHLFKFIGHILIQGLPHLSHHLSHFAGAVWIRHRFKVVGEFVHAVVFRAMSGKAADEAARLFAAAMRASGVVRLSRHAHERGEPLLARRALELVNGHDERIPSRLIGEVQFKVGRIRIRP